MHKHTNTHLPLSLKCLIPDGSSGSCSLSVTPGTPLKHSARLLAKSQSSSGTVEVQRRGGAGLRWDTGGTSDLSELQHPVCVSPPIALSHSC